MTSKPIEVVECSHDAEKMRQRISDLVMTFLPNLVRMLVIAEVDPIVVTVAIVSGTGIYSNAISNRELCGLEKSNEIVEAITNLLRVKIAELTTVTCYSEPPPNAPRS